MLLLTSRNTVPNGRRFEAAGKGVAVARRIVHGSARWRGVEHVAELERLDADEDAGDAGEGAAQSVYDSATEDEDEDEEVMV